MLVELGNKDIKMPLLLNELIKAGERVRVIYSTGYWLDIASFDEAIQVSLFK
ncbi:MAG: hypothetical protein NPIRA02_16280 [Nitrospirales bacterium]|nr:MAG: hypothetical protein NPIRA02_16280 [Nitrospirales bacterium]